jgi:hypothetical protein
VGDRGSCGVKWGIMAEDGIHSVDEKDAVRSGISAEEGGKKEDVAPCGEEMVENRVESASAERNEDSQVDASNVDVFANMDDPVGGGEVASREEVSWTDGNAGTMEEAAGDVEGALGGELVSEAQESLVVGEEHVEDKDAITSKDFDDVALESTSEA